MRLDGVAAQQIERLANEALAHIINQCQRTSPHYTYLALDQIDVPLIPRSVTTFCLLASKPSNTRRDLKIAFVLRHLHSRVSSHARAVLPSFGVQFIAFSLDNNSEAVVKTTKDFPILSFFADGHGVLFTRLSLERIWILLIRFAFK